MNRRKAEIFLQRKFKKLNIRLTGRKEIEMKNYQVFYWIKKNSHEYLEHMFVSANNAKDACRICKEQVKEQTGRNAFRPTTKAPDVSEYANLTHFVVD